MGGGGLVTPLKCPKMQCRGERGTLCDRSLRNDATSPKVAGSISDEIIGFFTFCFQKPYEPEVESNSNRNEFN
jgi:hypothetical protein